MTAARLTAPSHDFATAGFWQRLHTVAARQGHDRDHGLHLVGETTRDDRYTLRCVRCDVPVVELTVDRG